jgi:hypothetical protein
VQKHEEYESLCAQALIGQLSPAEHTDLVAHMRSCESCCRAAREFVDVMQHLPIEASEASSQEIRELEEDARLQQFLSRAQGEGVVFSKDALEPEPSTYWWRTPSFPRLIFAPALATMVMLGGGLALLVHRSASLTVNVPDAHVVPVAPAQMLKPSGHGDHSSPSLAAEFAQTQSALKSAKQRLTELNSNLEASDRSRSLANLKVRSLEELLAQLRSKDSEHERQLAQMTGEVKKSQADHDHAVASLVADETRMRDLETELSNAQAAVEQEKELNAAARDVRELMGARNLHIIDVYDSDSRSRADRSFGRVIYTEGKSLIFYAFDLDKARNVKKVSFQAWGEREGEHRDAKKLGVFYVDDAAQKRWVLKVNDPEKLKSIDTVFVTVESHKDVNVPNRQRLLQAYFGSAANHP